MQNAKVQNPLEDSAFDNVEEPSFAMQEDGGTWHVKEDAANPNLRERTTHYARRIIRLYVVLAKNTLSGVPGKQLLRSGTSVGANYRECCRGRSKAEFIAKLGDCLRELDESAYWLELIAAEELLPVNLLTPLRDENKSAHLHLCCLSKTGKIPRLIFSGHPSFSELLHSAF